LAAKYGKIQFIKLFFEEDPNSLQIINSLNLNIESPLSISVFNNYLEITELLVKYGARVSNHLFLYFFLYILLKNYIKVVIYLTFFFIGIYFIRGH
jgi:ankyrin repeat protein